jgi:hypothetical protein
VVVGENIRLPTLDLADHPSSDLVACLATDVSGSRLMGISGFEDPRSAGGRGSSVLTRIRRRYVTFSRGLMRFWGGL